MTELLIFVVVLLILCLCAVIESATPDDAWLFILPVLGALLLLMYLAYVGETEGRRR